MFFVASKTIGFLANLSNVLMMLCLIGIILSFTRYRRVGFGLTVAISLLIVFFAYSPAGRVILLPLEQRFPPWIAAGEEPDGVIVLGGIINGLVSYERGVVELGPAADRLTAAASLARRYPAMRILFSGGIGEIFPYGETEAELAARFLESLGVSRGRVVLEDKSRNTAENARNSQALINPEPNERWLLVTSALHMPRAVGAFRRAGFPVEPYPVDWITAGPNDTRRFSSTASGGLTTTDIGVHEWIGLVVYWLSGQTSELFPSP